MASLLPNYILYNQPAIRIGSFGRKSRGLRTLINKNSVKNPVILKTNDLFISIRYKIDLIITVIKNVHIKPDLTQIYAKNIKMFLDFITIHIFHDSEVMMLGCDLISRIDLLNQVDVGQVSGTVLVATSNPADVTVTSRGRYLVKAMEALEFTDLNKRRKSDVRGYTFVEAIGCSTEDHVWTNNVGLSTLEDLGAVNIALSTRPSSYQNYPKTIEHEPNNKKK